MENEVKILGKYAFDEIYVKSPEDSEKEGFFLKDTDEQIFPTLWDEAFFFGSDGYAVVMRDERYGFINAMGELVIPCQWKEARMPNVTFPDGLCGVRDDNDLCGFINNKGEVVLPCRWKDCRDFRDGQCLVKDENDQWAYIDTKGDFIRALKWKDIGEWNDEVGMMDVQDDNGLWGFIDKEENLTIPCQWKETDYFQKNDERATSDYVCWVKDVNDLWGGIDQRGNVVIPCNWQDYHFFSEGLCAVQDKNSLWGAVDAHGNLAVPAEWDASFLFTDGTAIVKKGDGYCQINKRGGIVKDYGKVNDFSEASEKEDKYKFWAVFGIVAVLGIIFYVFSKDTGYVDYNPLHAYSLLNPQQWLGWLVSALGGLHTYDLLLPLALVVGYLFKRFSKKDEFEDGTWSSSVKREFVKREEAVEPSDENLYIKWTTKLFGKHGEGISTLLMCLCLGLALGSLSIFYIYITTVIIVVMFVIQVWTWVSSGLGTTLDRTFSAFDACVVSLMLYLSLRIVYFSLFAINYTTAGTPQPTELTVVSTDYESHRNSRTYYLMVEVDDGMPYLLEVNEKAYKIYSSGKARKVLADVLQGSMGFSIVSDFKTENVTQKDELIMMVRRSLPQSSGN